MRPEARLAFAERAPGIALASLTFGFLDEPDVPAALVHMPEGWRTDVMRTSYMLGRQTLVPAANPGMARWRERLFAAMVRLSGAAMEY